MRTIAIARTVKSAGRTVFNALLLVTMISLSACGFSLRGSDSITDSLPALVLNLQQPNGEIALLLRRALDNAGVEVIELEDLQQPTDVPVLSVGAEQSAIRPATLTPRARAAQYDVSISVQASLIQGDTEIFGPEELTRQQIYYEDVDTLTGNQEEAEVIRGELRAELVEQILRRLAAVTPAVANR